LIELSGRAVGSGVLISKARRDLKVPIESRYHKKLLELLRRLGQSKELAWMKT
jgi:hypothetical protein